MFHCRYEENSRYFDHKAAGSVEEQKAKQMGGNQFDAGFDRSVYTHHLGGCLLN